MSDERNVSWEETSFNTLTYAQQQLQVFFNAKQNFRHFSEKWEEPSFSNPRELVDSYDLSSTGS